MYNIAVCKKKGKKEGNSKPEFRISKKWSELVKEEGIQMADAVSFYMRKYGGEPWCRCVVTKGSGWSSSNNNIGSEVVLGRVHGGSNENEVADLELDEMIAEYRSTADFTTKECGSSSSSSSNNVGFEADHVHGNQVARKSVKSARFPTT